MSLWGKSDTIVVANGSSQTITTNVGNNIVVGTGTTFSNVLKTGDVILYKAAGNTDVKLLVSSVLSNTQVRVKTAPTTGQNATAVAAVGIKMPKYVDSYDATHNIELMFIEDVNDINVKKLGITSPGWVKLVTYTDNKGNTRRRAETLITMKVRA